MKRTNKFISALISLVMLVSILPAHVAQAKTAAECIKYGTFEQMQSDGWHGTVLNLEKTDLKSDKNLDLYKLSIGLYDVAAFSTFFYFKYDNNVVRLVAPDSGVYFDITEENPSQWNKYFYNATVDGYVTLSDAVLTSDGLTNYTGRGGKISDKLVNTIIGGTTLMESAIGSTLTWADEDAGSSTYKTINMSWLVNDSGTSAPIKKGFFKDGYKELETSTNGIRYAWQTPKDNVAYVMTLLFALQDGKTIDKDTFGVCYDSAKSLKYWGSQSGLLNSSHVAVANGDEGIYMTGDIFSAFRSEEEPAAKRTVTFNVTNSGTGSKIPGASITLQSKDDSSIKFEATADSSGYYQFTEVPEGDYKYTVSFTGFAAAEQEVTIDEDKTYNVALTSTAEATYTVKINVRDADSEKLINDSVGATVTEGITQVGTTANTGYVNVTAKAGLHEYVASKDGYTSNSGSITVDASHTELDISLEPKRATITLPTVKDEKGNNLDDAQVTITKTSNNPTKAWNAGSSSTTENPGSTIQVPAGADGTDYSITTYRPGYTDTTIYAHVTLNSDGDTVIEYYSDPNHTNSITASEAETLTSTKVQDPYYKVDITNTSSTTYEATVRLNNLSNGSYGTFGLKYKPDLFTLSSFELTESTLQLIGPADTNLKGELKNEDAGYHVFTWSCAAENGITAKTSTGSDGSEGVVIAKYTFVLKSGVTANDIPTGAFTVMPYDQTTEAIAYKMAAESEDPEFNSYLSVFRLYFRYHADDTSTYDVSNQGVYADKENAIINGEDVGGFYQVFGLCDVREEEQTAAIHDAVTYINFEAKKSGLTFVVTDEISGNPIEGASVKLYNGETDKLEQDLSTNAVGTASHTVEVSDTDVEFRYAVTASGYWGYPESDEDNDKVTVKSNETTREDVKLERKIYHTPELQNKDGGTVDAETAALGGDPLAYYNRDYHFTIEPATGKTIKAGDLKLDNVKVFALIGDDEETAEQKEITGVTFDSETGLFTVPKGDENITKEPCATTVDANGFKSNKIIVKFLGEFVDDSKTFVVDALTNEGGTVEYVRDTGAWPGVTDEDGHKSVVKDINPNKATENGATGTLTGTFKFKANDDWKVDRVYINGVQVHQYDDLTNFEYSFKSVDMDNNITVLFYDGTNRSTDKVVTVVVGDFGSVSVAGDAELRNTRRVYINPASIVSFTANPDEDYTETVQRQVGTAARENVAGTSLAGKNSYSIPADENNAVTAYVSFAKDGSETPTVFVRSYVVQPETGTYPGGTITPTGILIFNKQASPKYTLTADIDNSWSLVGVNISELDKIDEGELTKLKSDDAAYDYTLENVQKDLAIGAVFKETPAAITGFIDLGQYTNVSNSDFIKEGALVTFIRVRDGAEDLTDTYSKLSDATRHGSKFSIEVPSGTWNVVVTKPGYLSYKITGFTINPGEKTKVFNEQAKPIVPLIGNASANGKVIALTDAATIRSGLRSGMNETVQAKADVDNDGVPDADKDLQYVMMNYGKRAITMTYSAFSELTFETPTW